MSRATSNRGETPTSARAILRRLLGLGDHPGRGAPAHQQGERNDRRRDHDADRDIGSAPADQRHRQIHRQRPDRPGEIISRGYDDDRQPAPLDEPMRNIRHHRPEPHPGADADQDAMRRREDAQIGRVASDDEAEAQSEAGDDQGNGDPGAVRHPSQHDRAEGETQHHQGVGQRGGRTVDAEFELRARQDDDDRPHARAEQGRDQQRQTPGARTRRGRRAGSGQRFRGIWRQKRSSRELAGSGWRWQAAADAAPSRREAAVHKAAPLASSSRRHVLWSGSNAAPP